MRLWSGGPGEWEGHLLLWDHPRGLIKGGSGTTPGTTLWLWRGGAVLFSFLVGPLLGYPFVGFFILDHWFPVAVYLSFFGLTGVEPTRTKLGTTVAIRGAVGGVSLVGVAVEVD